MDVMLATAIGWIAMTFGADIQAHLRVNCYDCCDTLNFLLAPSSAEHFNLFNAFDDQIPAKLTIFPSASVVLSV